MTGADQPPLPFRRRHPRIAAALELLRGADLAAACRAEPPALLRRGVAEFNQRKFFEQHESLERLWRAERGPIRYLYQSILQLGVGFLHLERGNFHGAVVKLENGLALLAAFEPVCQGVDVARLRHEAAGCLRTILELGPDRLAEFDRRTLPSIILPALGCGCATITHPAHD